MNWCGPAPDRIGHAVAALLPAETAADGPWMSRPRITMTTFTAVSPRRGARHCLAVHPWSDPVGLFVTRRAAFRVLVLTAFMILGKVVGLWQLVPLYTGCPARPASGRARRALLPVRQVAPGGQGFGVVGAQDPEPVLQQPPELGDGLLRLARPA